MPKLVSLGAKLKCNFGTSPGNLLVVRPAPVVSGSGKLAATIMDFAPFSNVTPFGQCRSLANPIVQAATSGTPPFGQLKPQPCIPALAAPWAPGATRVRVAGLPALLDNCRLTCLWGGSIEIQNPGQVKAQGK